LNDSFINGGEERRGEEKRVEGYHTLVMYDFNVIAPMKWGITFAPCEQKMKVLGLKTLHLPICTHPLGLCPVPFSLGLSDLKLLQSAAA
jgi:hypothetical protein